MVRRTALAKQPQENATVAMAFLFAYMVLGWLCVRAFSRIIGDADMERTYFVAGCALVNTTAMLVYWCHVYRMRGRDDRPRFSLGEGMVIYFGLSIEDGFLVETWRSGEQKAGWAAILLPPALVIVMALLEAPSARRAMRRPTWRGPPRAGCPCHERATQSAATTACSPDRVAG
jgi:hypothetical protein